MSYTERLRRHVLEIPDFPKPGLRFRDITPILRDPEFFCETIDALAELLKDRPFDLIVGIESRGFIFAAALAYRMRKGFLPIQWSEKLPDDKRTVFRLEYGFNAIGVHADAFRSHPKILVVDDLVATGATLAACADLLRQAGGDPLAAAVIVEVSALEGRQNINGLELLSLCQI